MCVQVVGCALSFVSRSGVVPCPGDVGFGALWVSLSVCRFCRSCGVFSLSPVLSFLLCLSLASVVLAVASNEGSSALSALVRACFGGDLTAQIRPVNLIPVFGGR